MKWFPIGMCLLLGCPKTPPLISPTPPAPSIDADLAELHAFAELVGLVRFFHPSDEVASTPWDLFMIHGAQTLLAEPGFQVATLQGLFAPIAPSVQLSTHAPPAPQPLPQEGDRLVAWGHRSVGLDTSSKRHAVSFRSGRPVRTVDMANSMGWLSHRVPAPKPLPARWRLRLEVSGDPGAHVAASVWEFGADGARISRQTQAARAAGSDTRSVLTMEHDTAGLVDRLNLSLTTSAIEYVTIHAAHIAWADAEGNWSPERSLPIELGESSTNAWTFGGRGYTCTGEDSGLVCARDGSTMEGTPFEVPTQAGELWQGAVGDGLFATIPLALPGDKAHTYPRGHDAEAEAQWRQVLAANQGDDRSNPAIRVASVIQAWTVMRHFHPHPESLTATWDELLDGALAEAMDVKQPLPSVLGRMLTAIPDGHIAVVDHQPTWMRFPLHLEEADGRVFVVDSALPDIHPGDEVVAVRGEGVRVVMDRVYAQTPGTDHWRRIQALKALRTAPDKFLTLTIVRDGEALTQTVSFDDRTDRLGARGPFEELDTGLYYLDLRKRGAVTPDRIQTLANARGLVVDLRGYPSSNPILEHLTPAGMEPDHDWAKNLWRARPDEVFEVEGTAFAPEPAEPLLDLPTVWLTGPRAISYSESVLGWARHLDPDARFVGASPTAGANGINQKFPLIGAFDLGWTSMRATMLDGSPYFGEGIGLDETTPWTSSAIAENRDPGLDAALAWLNEDRLPEPFLGAWKGDDGAEVFVTRTAVYRFDSNGWRGRLPILGWTEDGPRLCDRGLVLADALTLDSGRLRLLLLLLLPHEQENTELVLSRHSETAVPPRIQARVLLEPPPPVSAEQVAALKAELERRAARMAVPRDADADAALSSEQHAWFIDQLDTVGWIDPERFGLEATQHAAALAYHLPDLTLQMAVAPRLAGFEGLAHWRALLLDSIAAQLGEPQRFGTATRALPDGTLAVAPVDGPERVAEERLALGLDPWHVYLSQLGDTSAWPILDCTETPTQTVPAAPR